MLTAQVTTNSDAVALTVHRFRPAPPDVAGFAHDLTEHVRERLALPGLLNARVLLEYGGSRVVLVAEWDSISTEIMGSAALYRDARLSEILRRRPRRTALSTRRWKLGERRRRARDGMVAAPTCARPLEISHCRRERRSVKHARFSETFARRFLTALLTFAALAAIGATPAVPAQQRVPVYFLQGEQLARVDRPGATPLDALRQLVAGPTRAEAGRGFRTYVPAGTQVLSVEVANGTATVDLNERFASGSDAGSLLARLSQLVRTLTGLPGRREVQLLMNGGLVAARFPASPRAARSLPLPPDAERAHPGAGAASFRPLTPASRSYSSV